MPPGEAARLQDAFLGRSVVPTTTAVMGGFISCLPAFKLPTFNPAGFAGPAGFSMGNSAAPLEL
ncbi:MAG: hypothetical protein R6U13_11265 [Desulfatiglandaceae bacterium]